jgi:hypothetical protein
MCRILIFKSHSEYDLLPHWVDELATALRVLSVEVAIIDTRDKLAWKAQLEQEILKKFDLIFTFNAIGLDLQHVGRFYDVLSKPVLSYFCDHFYHHLSRLEVHSPCFFYSVPDFTHLEYFQRLFPHKSALVLPHAASSGEVQKEKTLDIVLFGTFRPPEEIKEKWNGFPSPLRKVLFTLADLALEKSNFDPIKVIEEYYFQLGCLLSPEHLKHVKVLYIELEIYLRNELRKKLLVMLDQAGISVDLFGKDWRSFQNSCHRVRKPLLYGEAIKTMSQAKFVLNSCPVFSHSGHERALSAMNQGAIAITDSNLFYEQEFIPNKDLITYRWTALEQLPDTILTLLKNQTEIEEIANRGQLKVREKHTWLHRATHILKLSQSLSPLV